MASFRSLGFAALLLLPFAAPATESSAPLVSVPRFTHPGAGQTIYILMPDRFANGRTDNDTGGIPGGPQDHGFDPTRISHHHGGDFAGLIAKLDYIKGLNVSVIWTTPPYKNQPTQATSSGYHGYWPVDFLSIDPHFGTNDEYREFIHQAKARGLKVYLDIITNHTGDIIFYDQHTTAYRDKATFPFRDANGQPFDDRTFAYNGLNSADAFPALSAERSFAYVPHVRPEDQHRKNPAWLNDLTLYTNRGNTTFKGENSLYGDFVGLDDLFTAHPRVVHGFIDIYTQWLDWGVDGFRIDTMRHVNSAFWQAFNPALRAAARARGRPEFLQFGEIMNEQGDVAYLTEFSTGTMACDTTTDFPFATAARKFVSQGESAATLADYFARDDYHTDHDGNVHTSITLLGNYDIGRFAYFLQQDNPGASLDQIAELSKFGHALLYFARGMPVLHYGDEQGMIGRTGNDQGARETMFATLAPTYRDAPLLGTKRTGADDKFDPSHPFYQLFAQFGALRAAHPALRTGAMLVRPTSAPNVFAFSRFDRAEHVEYLAVFNNSRTTTITATLPTSQPAGATFSPLFNSRPATDVPTLTADADHAVRVTLAPLHYALYRADAPLPTPARAPTIAFANPVAGAALAFTTREIDGESFPTRREFRAEVAGTDGFAEVTFALRRASRPDQYELLGTDDAPPYRLFWTPPADFAPGEKFEIIATIDDLRGHRASASLTDLTVAPAPQVSFGIPGSKTPLITSTPPATLLCTAGSPLTLTVIAEGTGPLEYQWLRNNVELSGATQSTLTFAQASAALTGHYRVLVRNRAGTAVSAETAVTVTTDTAGRIETLPRVPSQFVPARRVDVWLPPGYNSEAGMRYPVVYLHDGQNLFDPATGFGGACWEIDRAALRLIQAKKISGVILVGVWNTGLGRYPEYMPQKAVRTDPVAFFSEQGPTMPAAAIRSDAYLRFLVTELKPLIDRTYRTQSDAAHTFVMGSSMGGLISAYALTEHPTVFGGAACVSTHWPAGNGAVIDYLAAHLPKPGGHKLYFDHGTATLDAQYEPFQQRMDAVMRQAGYTEGRDWLTRKFPGAEHSEKSWRERVEIPLQFLLQE